MFHPMRDIAWRLALALLCLSVLLSASDALACSCHWVDLKLTDAERKAWSFERAATVVRGQITEVNIGSRTMPDVGRVFVAKMDVTSVVKGDAPTGEIIIVTLPGVAFDRSECGAAHVVLFGVVRRTELLLEVKKMPESQNEFFIDLCGYAEAAAASSKR